MSTQAVERDGVRLSYERSAGSRKPIVFVHGWCCDRSFFAPQFEHFAEAGHTVVGVDLRGHGESDKPQGSYSMQVFADDLAWLAGKLGLEKPVLIGHSMGGVVCFDLAARYPGLAAAIVMIDSPVVRPPASRATMPGLIDAFRGPNYKTAVADYASKLFAPTDDPERKARLLAAMAETRQHVIVAAFEGLRDYDPEEGRGRTLPPSLYIAAGDAPRSDMARFNALAPKMRHGQTVGSGHFCQLEVPDQVNAMIGRFLAIVAAEPAA